MSLTPLTTMVSNLQRLGQTFNLPAAVWHLPILSRGGLRRDFQAVDPQRRHEFPQLGKRLQQQRAAHHVQFHKSVPVHLL